MGHQISEWIQNYRANQGNTKVRRALITRGSAFVVSDIPHTKQIEVPKEADFSTATIGITGGSNQG